MADGFFRIDQNRLDAEWLKQPQLYYEYAVILADAKEALGRARAKREVVVAEIDKDVRLRPEKYGVEKITEGVVEKTVILQERYQVANKGVIGAKHDVDIAQAAVDTLDHRKRALQDLVQLRMANYFSEPRMKGGKEQMDEERMRQRRRVKNE